MLSLQIVARYALDRGPLIIRGAKAMEEGDDQILQQDNANIEYIPGKMRGIVDGVPTTQPPVVLVLDMDKGLLRAIVLLLVPVWIQEIKMKLLLRFRRTMGMIMKKKVTAAAVKRPKPGR
jgi:hypothetical protein